MLHLCTHPFSEGAPGSRDLLEQRPTQPLPGWSRRIASTDPIRPEELGSLDLGDIFVCPRFIREQAGRDPVLLRQFLCAAVAHGLCHLLGYTHDTSDNAKQVRSTPLFS